MQNNTEQCPTCGGQGYMYQIETQLGGDLFQEPPIGCFSQKVNCPRCGGSGNIVKILAAIFVAAIAFYFFS